jgi:pimeloyl-ACP methyl ester carboxylesterase
MDDGVAFVINSSGPATSLRRQDTYMMENTLRFSGFSDDEIALVKKGLNVLYDFGQGKATAEALDAVMDQARSHPKLKDLALPPAKQISIEAMYAKQKIGDPVWYFHLNPDNDALAPYRKLRCPTLVTYGRLDYLVPVEESVKLLNGIIAEKSRLNLTIEIIPDSGHGYLRMEEAHPVNPIAPMSISRAYFAVIEKWLKAHGFVGTDRTS